MRAVVLARQAAAPIAARSPSVPCAPPTPLQLACTLHFASLFEESDDEGCDAPREAGAQQLPPRCGARGAASAQLVPVP